MNGVAANNKSGGWVDTEYRITFLNFGHVVLYTSTTVKHLLRVGKRKTGGEPPEKILVLFVSVLSFGLARTEI